jgi:hypothetical protein
VISLGSGHGKLIKLWLDFKFNLKSALQFFIDNVDYEYAPIRKDAMSRIIAYHATNSPEDFDRFEFSEDFGFHFGTTETANNRAAQIIDPENLDSMEFLRVIPCVLQVNNPLRLPDGLTWGVQDTLSALHGAGLLDDASYDELSSGGYLDQEMFREIVESGGYDCVVYDNRTEGGGESYMILNSDAIGFLLGSDMDAPLKRKRFCP